MEKDTPPQPRGPDARRCLPKGHGLDGLAQETAGETFPDIYSYVGKSKGDQAPYDIAGRKFGKEVLDKIGISRTPKKKVWLLLIALPGRPKQR